MNIEYKERKRTKKDEKVIANLIEIAKYLEENFGGKILQFSFDVETQKISFFQLSKKEQNHEIS